MEFRGERVTLKELSIDHIESYMRMFSSTVKQLLHVDSTICERSYIEYCIQQHMQRRYFCFTIFDNHEQILIGSLFLKSPHDYKGQLESWINEDYWGSGRYQESLALITREYFDRSTVSLITAHVYTDNMRSYKAHKKFGFMDIALIDGAYGKQYVLAYKR